MSLRAVKQILETSPVIEGAGVKLQRAPRWVQNRQAD